MKACPWITTLADRSVFRPRMGRSRAFSRPWSHSTRLFWYRAVDQHGQVIDVFVSRRRDIAAARRFFATALAAHREPVEVVTDRAAALANVIEDLLPAALHNTAQYENNRVESGG